MERLYVCTQCSTRLIHNPSQKCTCHAIDCSHYTTRKKCPLGTYTGETANELKHGKGTWEMPSGKKYIGEWRNEMRHGYGVYSLPNGEKYEGMWSNSIRHGHGTYTYPNGDHYEGQWCNGMKHGTGKWTTHDDITFEGEWVCDKCAFNLTLYIENTRTRRKPIIKPKRNNQV